MSDESSFGWCNDLIITNKPSTRGGFKTFGSGVKSILAVGGFFPFPWLYYIAEEVIGNEERFCFLGPQNDLTLWSVL